MMTITDIIRKKRDGGELQTEEINHFIKCVVTRAATEAQIGAWLMSAYIKGMTDRETADMTKAMACTGDTLQCKPEWRHLLVDKHSTGGVGDKVSLVLAPALASLGLKVPMISGRGLDITGGTLDKLESIPGFQVQLSLQEMHDCLDKVGCFIAGQTDTLAPADRILYRIRDSTSTVSSPSLITSSILSKKAAEGISNLVMDIKIGCGGWFKNVISGTEFASRMVDICKHLNIDSSYVLSDMNVPLGRCVGNALEVLESVECLSNRGSADVRNLVKTLGGLLLCKKGIARSIQEGEEKIQETLSNGKALMKFREMLLKQGVGEDVADSLCSGKGDSVLPKSLFITRYSSPKSGVIRDVNAANIGKACWLLSRGEIKPGSCTDYSSGIRMIKTIEEEIQKDEDWIEVHHNEENVSKHVENLIRDSLTVTSPQTQTKTFNRILTIL